MFEEESPLSSPRGIPIAPLLNGDNTNALGQQLSDIFSNLISLPESRPMRMEECLNALMDTLFAHANTIAGDERLQRILLRLVDSVFDASTSKGCRVFDVVFDLQWRDLHEKRNRCLSLLLNHALKTESSADCQEILETAAEVLKEHALSTTDLIEEHLSKLTSILKTSPVATRRAASCHILTKFIATSAPILKRNPAQLELLKAVCLPSALLQAEVETTNDWYRTAAIDLLSTMVTESCYEVSVPMATQIAEMMTHYMATVAGETQLKGVLYVLSSMATAPGFRSAAWNLPAIADFLMESDWSFVSKHTKAVLAYTTGKVAYVLFSEDDALYERLSARVLQFTESDDLEVVSQSLDVIIEALKSERGLSNVSSCVEAMGNCIYHIVPYTPKIFEVLVLIRSRYGENAIDPIYSIVDVYMNSEDDFVNYGKLNALIRFKGKKLDLNRPEFQALPIILTIEMTDPVLIRSLPMLTTLERTNQLEDAVEMLYHDTPAVRLSALETVIGLCEIILSKENDLNLTNTESFMESPPPMNLRVNYAVESILDVVVSDRDSNVRHKALTLLSPPFYPYLCLPDNLDAIYIANNDTFKAVQYESLILLCRLYLHYPGNIHPQLMCLQGYILRDVDALSSSISLSIYRIGLLQVCSDHHSLLLEPESVEKVILKHLIHQPFVSKKLSIALLGLLNSILEHSGPDNHCDFSEISNSIIEFINSSDSSLRRQCALNTLCSLLTTLQIPDDKILIDIYRNIVRIIRWEGEEDDYVVVAAMKVIGTIGAVNPVKIRPVLSVLDTDEVQKEVVVTPALTHFKPHFRLHTNMAERYPSVVLYYMVKALQLTIDPRPQVEILAAVRSMLREIPGNQEALLLTHLFPQLQMWLRELDKTHLYETTLLLMIDLAVLLRQYKEVVPPTTGRMLLKSVKLFSSMPQATQKPLNTYVVQLLDELAKGLPSQEMQDHRWAVEFIHQRLLQNKNDLDLVHRVVKSLESFSFVMHEKDIQLILPHVLRCIEPAKATPALQRPKMKVINDACFDFLNYIMLKDTSLIKDCCAQIVHIILWYIELSDSEEEMNIGLDTLANLMNVLGKTTKRFIRLIDHVSAQSGFPDDYFKKLVQLAGSGMKVRFPLTNNVDFNPDLPLRVISHLPRLSQQDFIKELQSMCNVTDKDCEILSVAHIDGQTIIDFRFTTGPYKNAWFNLFTRKAQDRNSTLRRKLVILKVEQCVEMLRTVDCDIINAIAMIPSAKTCKREQSWISWLHNTSVLLLRNSPYSPLRGAAVIADRNRELARDLFPFAAVAIISNLPQQAQTKILSIFSNALELSPMDTRQTLFTLAEFMETKQVGQKPRRVTLQKETKYTVERTSTHLKFGIKYDQYPNHGIVITKLTADGFGITSGVPLGGQLISINDKPIYNISEISSMIEDLNRIDLTISHPVEEFVCPETCILMDIEKLAKVAFNSQMHAKAIYFNEVLFEKLKAGLLKTSDTQNETAMRCLLSVAERLIEFYGHLNLTMVASGLVKYLTNNFSDTIISPKRLCIEELNILEQLHWWKEALKRYQLFLNSQNDEPVNLHVFLGMLRCEEALGNMARVNEVIEQHWCYLDEKSKREVAPHRAKAAFLMGEWNKIDQLASDPFLLEKFGRVERCAALFRRGEYDQLLAYTQTSRESMLESFSDSFNESYSRSYNGIVELQNLTHFEELVSYVRSNPDRRLMLKNLWQRRISNLSSRSSNWKTMISINSLVLTPQEDLASEIMAIHNFTKMHWHQIAEQLLDKLLGHDPPINVLLQQDPGLIHAYIMHLSGTKSRQEAYTLLKNILLRVQTTNDDLQAKEWGMNWLLLGEWTMTLFPGNDEEAIEELLRAVQLAPDNSLAYHSLGILHYDLSRDPLMVLKTQTEHQISAVIALFKSVQLLSDHSNSNVMQDTLLILSIWLSHSTVSDLNEAVRKGVLLLPDHVWLHVIPQLIARIGITAKLARSILEDLLVRVGTSYPHALIYPLTVAEKSPEAIRRRMAEQVLAGIRVTNNQLVDEASLISNEMVRIAILWTEKWHATIQQAAYNPDDAVGIMKLLAPLYDELGHAMTPNECNFEKTFGPLLMRAKAELNERSLDKAWTYLKQAYTQLSKILCERRLYMNDISPTLDNIRDSIVAVPGTFSHGSSLVTIQKFRNYISVMPSKQKPRRFGIDASDGKTYYFLLKGHEDMRQDERVMQFIGLINTIFMSDNAATSIGLRILQYAVIPLTNNVGIIGWVEKTETIYKMLETHRRETGVSIYEEINLIIKKGDLLNIDEYHHLPKQQRKALLSYAMECTPDDELCRIFWKLNDSCEQWLNYRNRYGFSLAAMSMVGYVLGLGDRHLNNLMLNANGMVVHIDFGDCFEVAMQRALYVESVPFRLTRLLVASLGITGVEGVYRLTSELVMRNLRRNSENLLTILETFIYDPLINWRLTAPTDGGDKLTPLHTENIYVTNNEPLILKNKAAGQEKCSMQLSKTYAKAINHMTALSTDTQSTPENGGEEEIRNQQGNLALARVRAKLTGQDFDVSNNSFSINKSSRRAEDENSIFKETSLSSSVNGVQFAESLKDSFAGLPPMQTSYLSLRALLDGGDSLDIQQQVEKLIQQATSIDNLANAYLTGWAPFW
ncbi:unnamed protein product [Phytomonas sp. Hart1]|nr:unnamed protein product [Phytomonas sp. Hart1]|eukprot:CCW67176.1 unnamed protein product [Phytomonas sp. isolate Hart1]